MGASTEIGPSLGTVVELASEREARHLDEARRAAVADHALWTASGLGAAWLAVYAACAVATTGNLEGRRFLGAVVYLVPIAFAAMLSGVAAWRATGRRRWLWSLLVVSNLLWLAGDLTWAGYVYLLHRVAPFPSAADGLSLASYAVVPAAVLVGFGGTSRRRQARSLLDVVVVGIGIGAAGWKFLIAPQLGDHMDLATATGIAYPLLGVVIVITIASVVLIGYRHVAASIWILAAAFTVSAFTDTSYTYLATLNNYVPGDWLNLGWQLEAVLLCLAAVCALRQREGDGQIAPLDRDLALVPVVLGVVAVMLATASEARQHGVSLQWLAVAAVVLTGFVVRFVLSVADARRAVVKLDDALQEQRRLAVTDGLTGLYNRRFFEEVLRLETERAVRAELPLALLVGDLDHFKDVNDAHGHESGDLVLVEAATRLRHALRGSDVLARYGGEEFVAILPDADHETAVEIAERCRRALADEPVRLSSGRQVTVTGSFGVAPLVPDAGWRVARDAAGLLRRADRALYAAKDAGRDRVAVAPAHDEGTQGAPDVVAPAALAPVELLADVVERRLCGGRRAEVQGRTPAAWAGLLAEALGLDADRRRLVVQAVRLQDAGMILLGDGVLGRPGPLTSAERDVLKTHPEHSAGLILGVVGQESLAAIVRGHHERWDGGGYPDGLAGSDLPLETRIVTVVGSWCAMLRPRPHRPALTPQQACEQLRAGRWTQFDGDVVDAFLVVAGEPAPRVSSPWAARASSPVD